MLTKRQFMFRGMITGAVAASALTVLSATPASAHTTTEAIINGCGSTYRHASSKAMVGASGSTVGRVIIAWVPNTQRYCALTNKIASHGSATDTYVCVAHRGAGDDICDRGNFGHFANITAWNAENKCIIARGRFKTTNNVWASAETILLEPNGSSCA